MSAASFTDLAAHAGHNIECVTYGDPAVNAAVECVTCSEVLLTFDRQPKVTARFWPQAWIGDHAIDVDPQGETEWDSTAAFWELSDDYRSDLLAEMDHEGQALDGSDSLAEDPAAPEWVRRWSGPFSIYVRFADEATR